MDRDGNLVVIELKRTEDGGHMDLQALRYAAMVSAMTLGQAATAYAKYLGTPDRTGDAKVALLKHIESEDTFPVDVRIVLVSADFSREITTLALWLRERDLDISCVRVRPHRLDGRILLDVQTVIPPPEASAYMERIKQQTDEKRERRKSDADFTRYDLTLDGTVRRALTKRALVYEAVAFALQRGTAPEEIAKLLPAAMWLSVPGDVSAGQFWDLIEEANAKGLVYVPKKYFCGDGELFSAAGRTWSISNQWTRDRMLVFVKELNSRFPSLNISCEPTSAA